jgi:hypothetical protein
MRGALKIALVVFVVVLAVGIFLPLVLRIRDASARLDCSNNLKQIVLAVQNYHDTYDKFPPGTHPSKDLPIEKRLSWMVEIRPFVENDHISWWSHHSESWDSPGNRFLLEDLTVFLCPSGPRMRQAFQSGLTHYVGNAGVGKDAATYPLDDKRIGFFGYDRQVSIKDVIDGLGNTIMVMETAHENGLWAAGGPPTVRGYDPDDAPYFGRQQQLGGMHLYSSGFFSRRLPSCNFGIGDGSVRFVDPAVDPQILQSCFTIAAEDNYVNW